MWTFLASPALALLMQTIFLVHCNAEGEQSTTDKLLDKTNQYQMNCGDNYESKNCFVEASFGKLASNESMIDVLVNCRDTNGTLSRCNNQFSRFDMVIWNGCYATRNLRFFGLQKIQANRKQVRYLKIEKFTTTSIESGTFDGFIQLEVLAIESNFIQNLSASCFRGLESLLELRLISNNLKWMSEQVLTALPKLNTLRIDEGNLLMANRQFSEESYDNNDGVWEGLRSHQFVEHVSMKIYHIQMDLVEHLFHHVRNLSISLTSLSSSMDYCELTRFNGYERAWLVQNLKLENHQCGFVIENVGTLRTLELRKVILAPISASTLSDFKLKNLQNLTELVLNHNELSEITQSIFEGAFEELEVLDLSHNHLTEIDMSILRLFPKLRHIDLGYNSIHQMQNMHSNHIHKITVDFNRFDCEWLIYHASKNFAYTKRFATLNVNGLECTYQHQQQPYQMDPCVNTSDIILSALNEENFILPLYTLILIICGSILLGFIITYTSIYLNHRRLLWKQEPFYHMLRDSLIQPFTVARDFKGVLWRKLPPTNYEQPISESNLSIVVGSSDLTRDMDAGNIYEEIPAKIA